MPIADHVNLVSLTHPLKPRVGVMGAGGKTTLARAIAAKMDIEFIEIDWITHMPGWQIRPEDDVKKIVQERMQVNPRGWVTDHHSHYLRELILPRAQAIIVLELPFRTYFWRRFKRSVKRAWTKEVVCGGNVETFRQHFASRDSAILENWQRRGRYSQIGETAVAAAPPGLDFYEIRSARELDDFYDAQGLSMDLQITGPGHKTAPGR